MKLAIKLVAAARTAAWLAVLVAPFCTALGQGSLIPVGPPAPTMKTLDQIEARTPISSAPFTISQSGSYYLTNNLTVSSGDAITIAASSVSLDLNGFTISSTAASATGLAIHISGAPKNLVIRNGLIQSGVTNNGGTYSGSGFSHGIIYSNTPPVNVRVTDLTVTGVAFNGIHLGWNATLVESCTVLTAGSVGVFASTIKNSIAQDCGGDAILGQLVSDCRGVSTVNGGGVFGDTVLNSYGVSQSGNGVAGQTVQNCYGYSVSGTAVYADATASNCYGVSFTGTGISASTAENCHGQTNGDAHGVYAQSAQNCRGFSGTGRGVFADTAENCYGVSGSGVGGAGIFADTAQNCRGSSSNGTGISATTALNCTGYTTTVTATAIFAVNAQNCYAYAAGGGIGLSAQKTAQNCFGLGAYGIRVAYGGGGIATNCHGVSTGNGYGVHADIAIGCYGESTNGYGILAFIANCCRGFGSPIGIAANFKYNMP